MGGWGRVTCGRDRTTFVFLRGADRDDGFPGSITQQCGLHESLAWLPAREVTASFQGTYGLHLFHQFRVLEPLELPVRCRSASTTHCDEVTVMQVVGQFVAGDYHAAWGTAAGSHQLIRVIGVVHEALGVFFAHRDDFQTLATAIVMLPQPVSDAAADGAMPVTFER